MLLGLRRMQEMKNEKHQRDHQETEDAPFGADCAAGEPAGTLDHGMRKRAFGQVAAVGYRVEKRLAPIEAAVQADGEPQSAGALRGEAEKHGDHEYARGADPSLSRISKMSHAKCAGQNSCGGPEANSSRQRKLRVAAEEVF